MCKKKKKKKKKAFTKTVPNSCLGSAEWILLPPNGQEMKPQTTFHLLKKWILLVWKSPFVRVGKTGCFIDYQKQSPESPCIFMLQLSAKQIKSCQSSSSLNLSNSTALNHLPHSSSTNYSWRKTVEAANLQQTTWSKVTLQ